MSEKLIYKDEVLNQLAEAGTNIAQFVSYGPDMVQRFARIREYEPNKQFDTVKEAVERLLLESNYQSVNIRTYRPDSSQSQPFVYGMKDADLVVKQFIKLAGEGLYTIIHETVDINDGGVSGVSVNGILEFSPGNTVRFVESGKEPVAVFPKGVGIQLLKLVYGFEPDLLYPETQRVEFSIHPDEIGLQATNTIIWEIHETPSAEILPHLIWPTAFSKLIGDKAYGLVIAHLHGCNVPFTQVFPRNSTIVEFSFGKTTSSDEVWVRTCPKSQVPGKYTTTRGWQDPFNLMETDDPTGEILASCLVQNEVSAMYSGATISSNQGPIIVGVVGFGDDYMQGIDKPVELPEDIYNDVSQVYDNLMEWLGPIRFEWAHDGYQVWVLQLHTDEPISSGRVIVPGTCKKHFHYTPTMGLEYLRYLISDLEEGTGILVHGNVGMTSHICDVLRKAKVPSELTNETWLVAE